ncbi:MAG: chromate transporter [Spirochaetia bacterium]|jgi:chromate transporter|nr:chromate transporter [Spirochaetia bacterium]
MQILEIIWTFLKIGIVSFGGGWSIVGIIHNEVVPRWISEQGFLSLIAVAQSTPGPIALNAATMIGWEYGGFFTAMAATLSVVAFPVIAILTATYLARFLKLRAAALNESLKTGSIAMMLMALWGLKPTSGDPVLLAMALGAFALAAFTKINALWAILGSGALNAIAGPAIRALLGIGG